MILNDMDFTSFYNNMTYIFSKHFTTEEINTLMEYVEILSDANFRCYRANMVVIAERKKELLGKSSDDKLIADMEWVARSVGEYRVSSKARINLYISRVKSVSPITEAETWISDDIVYSIGEMIDRLSIETIKRQDFFKNKRTHF